MNDEIKDGMSMTDNENYFLKEMIRTYYQPEIEKLKEEITNLQQRIDKAIEYIYDFSLADSIILKRSYKDLLNILKGDSND